MTEHRDSSMSARIAMLPGPLRALAEKAEARWNTMLPLARGAFLVSVGSMTLVIMAIFVKILGSRMSSFEIQFFRSLIGLLLVLPFFISNPMEPLRTKRFGMHFVRGFAGSIGNTCFFWTIANLMLADAMALQFSRPLFMIPLAMIFLSEVVGLSRILVTIVGFAGIMLYARPFTAGFDPGAFVGAAGAMAGGCVVICIKRLSSTEPTRVIMFYYAVWNTVFALIPALIWWVTPTWPEVALLVLIGFLGIVGQSLITHGYTMGDATALVPLDYARIVYSAFFGYVLFSEVPGPWSLAGMALIVGSSLYLVLTEKKRG